MFYSTFWSDFEKEITWLNTGKEKEETYMISLRLFSNQMAKILINFVLNLRMNLQYEIQKQRINQ